MNAREKLNIAYVNGAIVVAGVLAMLAESWMVFWLSLDCAGHCPARDRRHSAVESQLTASVPDKVVRGFRGRSCYDANCSRSSGWST